MLTIERVLAPDDELRQLVAELDVALSGPYSPDQHHALSFDELFTAGVRFFAVRLDGLLVGCGGVAFFDDYAEVKRMFTRPGARRRGVGMAMLRHLEHEAKEAGHARLRLETGMYQAEAVGLYLHAGFQPCDAFGDYQLLSPHAIETSVFYEKAI